jgi:uncharacterized membrane protein YsdA (DUF1294 family)
MGMRVFHHKTKKIRFKVLIPIFIIVHCGLFIILVQNKIF